MTNLRKHSVSRWVMWGILLVNLIGLASMRGSSTLRDFVGVQGDQLMENGKAFRFISFNIPNLHLVEDNMVFTDPNAWRWPDRFEITDALESVRQQGGTVVRIYVLSVIRTNDPSGTPRHVLGPGKFNEDGFRALDLVMQVANEKGIRIILPFVDNWSWWGGIAEYAGFRGKPKEAFWSDPEVIADFKQTIRYLVTRTNSLTGIRYSDEKAILCWETGNELQSPAGCTREIARYIKSLDTNHLVMDGFHTTELRPESLEIPEVDIVTTHHYPGGKKSFADLARENWAKAKGKKPYIMGEFGFVDTAAMKATMDAVIESGISGALVWSLRFRNRDGGFYWHSEPAGGDKYKAYHWPGFLTGQAYEERELLQLMKENAYKIRGLKIPKAQIPAAPHFIPVMEHKCFDKGYADIPRISWQGSAGALDYQVARAPKARGPWTIIGDRLDETAVGYRPCFIDQAAAKGAEYFYRVRARNEAGYSGWLNLKGPVKIVYSMLVDELRDFSQLSQADGVQLESRESRKTKEDQHRVAVRKGSMLLYQVPGPINFSRIYAYASGGTGPECKVFLSADGTRFTQIQAPPKEYPSGPGDYGYWTPVLYMFSLTQDKNAALKQQVVNARFMKIEFEGQCQVGRIEIFYGRDN